IPPPTIAERRNVVGIGIDMGPRPCDDPLYGVSNTAGGDPGDSNPIDFARVWAGTFNCFPIDRQLSGWAHSIGSSAAHEAAHNYGLSHADGEEVLTNEDTDEHPDGHEHHLMKAGSAYKAEVRARPRHFSDVETSALARNVGLAINTMWTWEFTGTRNNPKKAPATSLRMELLSRQKGLILSWAFAGATSPWINPVLSGPLGTRIINDGQSEREYYIYRLEWSVGN